MIVTVVDLKLPLCKLDMVIEKIIYSSDYLLLSFLSWFLTQDLVKLQFFIFLFLLISFPLTLDVGISSFSFSPQDHRFTSLPGSYSLTI